MKTLSKLERIRKEEGVAASAVNPVEGRKDDEGKLRYDLLPPEALAEVVAVYTDGAEIYSDRNWEQGIKFGRIFAAIMRHLWAFWGGSSFDKDSGRYHLAHACWGCLTLLQYTLSPRIKERFDDRSKMMTDNRG